MDRWHSRLLLGFQPYGAARLTFDPSSSSSNRPQLDVCFARQETEGASYGFSAAVPPASRLSLLARSHDREPLSPFKLLISTNQHLRRHHADIDVPKDLLLEELLADREAASGPHPTFMGTLAATSVGRDPGFVVAHVGGALANELHLSTARTPLEAGQLAEQTVVPFRTPILQVAFAKPFVGEEPPDKRTLVVRSHDETAFFAVSPVSGVSSDGELQIEPLARLTRVDTKGAAHLAAEPATRRVLDGRGRVWRIRGDALVESGSILDDPAGGNESRRLERGVIERAPADDEVLVMTDKQLYVLDERSPNAVPLYEAKSLQTLQSLSPAPYSISHNILVNASDSLFVLDRRKPDVPLISFARLTVPATSFDLSFTSLHPLSTSADCSTLLEWSPSAGVPAVRFLTGVSNMPQQIGLQALVSSASVSRESTRTGVAMLPYASGGWLGVLEGRSDGSITHSRIRHAGLPVSGREIENSRADSVVLLPPRYERDLFPVDPRSFKKADLRAVVREALRSDRIDESRSSASSDPASSAELLRLGPDDPPARTLSELPPLLSDASLLNAKDDDPHAAAVVRLDDRLGPNLSQTVDSDRLERSHTVLVKRILLSRRSATSSSGSSTDALRVSRVTNLVMDSWTNAEGEAPEWVDRFATDDALTVGPQPTTTAKRVDAPVSTNGASSQRPFTQPPPISNAIAKSTSGVVSQVVEPEMSDPWPDAGLPSTQVPADPFAFSQLDSQMGAVQSQIVPGAHGGRKPAKKPKRRVGGF